MLWRLSGGEGSIGGVMGVVGDRQPSSGRSCDEGLFVDGTLLAAMSKEKVLKTSV